jgi:CSLREA domain-containing protein
VRSPHEETIKNAPLANFGKTFSIEKPYGVSQHVLEVCPMTTVFESPFTQRPTPTPVLSTAASPLDLPSPLSLRRSSNLVFIDAALPDLQTLVAAAHPSAEVYLLNPAGDELAQISAVLAGRSQISSVQIVSHGSAGALQLGDTSLDATNLLDYAGILQSWAGSLSADADLLFYGCNLGADAAGQSFVQQIAALTGADVAASTDLTGSAALGGDWDLEFATGSIEASEFLSDWGQAAYQHLLANFTVTTTADTVNASDGVVSLREAINSANGNSEADTITFALAANSKITLSSQLELTDSATTTINGSSVSGLSISGGGTTRVFQVNGGASAAFTGLTITGGNAGSLGLVVGGGIYNDGGTVTVSNSTFSGNSAGMFGFGGGIYNEAGGTVTVSTSTFSDNSAGNWGGGIYNSTGTVTVSNSTFSGNSASFGGGIYNNFGTVTVSNSTFSGNSASTRGGGIRNFGGTLNLNNSIVAGNSASDGREIASADRVVTSGGNNLFGFSGDGGLENVTTVGSDIIPSVALAAILNSTLANNGGPTQTLALVAGSPAIDRGNTTLTTDQRGIARPQGTADDIGAFEFVPPNTAPVVSAIADQATFQNTATTVLFTIGDGETATNALTVTASSSNTALIPNSNIVLGGSKVSPERNLTLTPIANQFGTATITVNVSDGTITTSTTFTIAVGRNWSGGNGNDSQNGTAGRDRLNGNNGRDTLNGGAGDDSLSGGNGDDLLRGGLGNDIINGGLGADRFVLASGEGTDTIQDFQNGTDKIALAGGLTYSQLTIQRDGTRVKISFGTEVLAYLDAVNFALIDPTDFVAA